MDNSKKKEPWMEKNKILGFTLIELIAVLVILAVLALIVTPLVLGIIKKAKESARKRSIDGYGHAVELAVAKYMMHNGNIPYELSELNVQYNGPEVKCSIMEMNPDSSVFLSGCSVNNTIVENYTYGKDILPNYNEYSAGELINYKGNSFHVVKNSSKKKSYVVLLKDEPLTYDEVNEFKGISLFNVYNANGYGGISYGPDTNYKTSNAKIVLDAWTKSIFTSDECLDTRLIQLNDLINNYGYKIESVSGTNQIIRSDSTPNYIYNNNYTYWTMSQYEDSSTGLYAVSSYNYLTNCRSSNCNSYVIRPVVMLKKSAIGG